MRLEKLILSSDDSRYQQCKLSLMDNIFDPNITFDNSGVCNYYYQYKDIESKMLHGEARDEKFNSLIKEIKQNGLGRISP